MLSLMVAESSLTLHYTSADQRLRQLSMICADIETKLVWKGLLRDRLAHHRRTDLNYSDQVCVKLVNCFLLALNSVYFC